MRRYTYILTALWLLLAGCEKYHPLYDGQKFRAYHDDFSLIEGEGRDIYIPLEGGPSFMLKLSGGKGDHHSIAVEDSECLEYAYYPGKVATESFYEPKLIPDQVLLSPLKLGQTKVTIRDEDTDETISMNVHVCPSYKALYIYRSQNSIEEMTILSFKYGGPDNVVRICHGTLPMLRFSHVADGTYAFVKQNGNTYLELTYPADEYGQPSDGGEEVFRRYMIHDGYGNVYHDMMGLLNLSDLSVQTRSCSVQTKAYYPSDKYTDLMFLDVTESEEVDSESPDAQFFYCYSARVIPWFFDYKPSL